MEEKIFVIYQNVFFFDTSNLIHSKCLQNVCIYYII